MAIRIPQNKIQYNYTSGKEYMDETTHQEYQGYYYQLNGKIFAGREFNSNAPVLMPIPKDRSNLPFNFNKLLTQAATYTYGRISKMKIPNTKITSITSQIIGETPEELVEYYVKKINSNIIKQVNEETYNNTRKNPLYLTLQIKSYPLTDEVYTPKDLEEAEKQMPGIKAFLETV